MALYIHIERKPDSRPLSPVRYHWKLYEGADERSANWVSRADITTSGYASTRATALRAGRRAGRFRNAPSMIEMVKI